MNQLPKNKWTYWCLQSNNTFDKQTAEEVLKLVETAYAGTPMGSFLRTLNDVKQSQWQVLDFDPKVDADCAIFFRPPRYDELWEGRVNAYGKIQGIGHSGTRESKDHVMKQLGILLKTKGWWIEASDAMEKVLYRSMQPVKDPFTLRALFRDNNLALLNETQFPGRYSRKAGNITIRESVFGMPILSGKAKSYKL